MKKSELRAAVMDTGSHFFDCKTMKCFGDTMSNYGVFSGAIDTYTEENVEVWVLYRKQPVKHGLTKSAYFRKDNFKRTFKRED